MKGGEKEEEKEGNEEKEEEEKNLVKRNARSNQECQIQIFP
jgi:hypothetical protein